MIQSVKIIFDNEEALFIESKDFDRVECYTEDSFLYLMRRKGNLYTHSYYFLGTISHYEIESEDLEDHIEPTNIKGFDC